MGQVLNQLEEESLVVHYADILYYKINKNHANLSEKEIKNICKEIIKDVIKNYAGSNLEFTTYMAIQLYRLEKLSLNEEKFLIRYVLSAGTNEKIIKYFCNKYDFLLDSYKFTIQYNYLKNNFYKIVEESLSDINSVKNSVQKRIHSNIIKYTSIIKKKIRELETEAIKEDKNKIYDIKENYYYITEEFFYANRGIIPDKSLRKLIQDKFDKFLKAYINGKSNKTPSFYLYDRFNNFFSLYFEKQAEEEMKMDNLSKADKDKFESTIEENKDLIDYAVSKTKTLVKRDEIEKLITDKYMLLAKKYYVQPRSYPFRSYVKASLNYYVKILNKTYHDDLLNKIIKNCEEKNIISKDLVIDIICGWANYFRDNNIDNEEDFINFIFPLLLDYKEEDYKEIITLKKHYK